ncbi:hypothetical protein [Marinobacterium sediminicola]|uniref:Sulfotransferase domain-containing protein n=1 Tax=Marinobacterium sediminicola TaxID=518898 RepID=A0ABY1S0Z0_9GAMM|nr:hypothetical protein [Marinobacterium sediminicola]ULG68389.1 hypothetical protein LN244_11860 [Marinobacterium sediminicola]SMR74732.1 hypothetical protein SAMN04487964_10829 [Marinobacterium sediminicola]
MYKLVIHMGLPKTATTSLQNQIFLKLHQEGRINFLGRAYTSHHHNYFNPIGEIINLISSEDEVYNEDLLRDQFNKLLSKNKVNLISEESLTVSSIIKLDTVYKKLASLCKDCEVEILLALRNPVDFIYSTYIEMHRWKYHRIKGKDTFYSFYECLKKDQLNPEYDMFFFDRLFRKVKNQFKNINFYFFEEFKLDKEKLTHLLSQLLELRQDELSFAETMREENSRIKTKTGKEGESISLDQIIQPFIINRLPRVFVRKAKKIKLLKKMHQALMRFSSSISVSNRPVHPILSNTMIIDINSTLFVDKLSFSEEFGVKLEDLHRFRYWENYE